MFNLLFTRPIVTLLTVAGVAVLAPVIFPIVGVILKPFVRPVTNLYLDLADEMADALVERDERKGFLKPKGGEEELKRVAEVTAEDKAKVALESIVAKGVIAGF